MSLRIVNRKSFLLAASVLASTGCVIVAPDNETDSATAFTSTTSTTGDALTEPTGGTTTASTSTVGDTGTEETAAPTSGMTGTDSEGTSQGMTSEATTGPGTTAEGTTDVSTTDVSTTAESTTTGGGSDVEASCDAACTVFLECQPDSYPDKASCEDECIDGSSGTPDCEAAAAVFNNCLGGFSCKDLEGAVNGDFGACSDAFNEYGQACNP